jgi:hypothetical protein
MIANIEQSDSYHDKKASFSARHLTILRVDAYKDLDHEHQVVLMPEPGEYFPASYWKLWRHYVHTFFKDTRFDPHTRRSKR